VHRDPALKVLVSPVRMPGNPYIDLLQAEVAAQPGVSLTGYTRREIARTSWDVVHLHWPEWLVRTGSEPQAWADAAIGLSLLATARARGARVAWTAHDLRPHDTQGSRVLRWFMDRFAAQVDCLFALSERSRAAVMAEYPRLRPRVTAIVPHGHYRNVYPDPGTSVVDARRALGLPDEADVVLFFGQVRPYKDVPRLVECFRALRSCRAHLVVAGRPLDASTERAVVDAAGGDRRVHLHLRRIDDHDVHRYFRAARVVVLPYRRILNSGAALLALSFDRPVVVPASGSLVELEEHVGHGWVSTYDGPLRTEVLERAVTTVPSTDTAPLERHEWTEIGRATVDAYRHVVDARRPRRRVTA
jgi:glycosyltransferase involved in cell wall biosynthesis